MPTVDVTRPDEGTPAIVAPHCQPVADEGGKCGCHIYHELDADHHEWLLTLESRGFTGVLDFMTYLSVDADCEPTPGALRWYELADFVSMHNWADPVRMSQFAHDMERYINLRLGARL